MKKSFILVAILAAFTLVSCSGNTEKERQQMLDSSWKLETLANIETIITMEEDSYTLSFDTIANKAFGKANCNRYFSSYKFEEGNKIDFSGAGSTMMLCPDDNAEQPFLKMFDDVDTYRINNGKLELLDDKSVIAIFVPYTIKSDM